VRPTLVTLGGVELHSYGLAIALGFTVGTVVAVKEAGRLGLPDRGAFVDLLFWVLVAGIGGSRLAYVLLHAGDYGRLCAGGGGARSAGRVLADCAAALRLWQGGLVFYGGLLGAGAAVALFVRRRRWRFGTVADALAPGLALGHAVGRLGCFLAGCCYGRPWAAGLRFPRGSVAFDELAVTLPVGATATPPLHPTQLYEAAGELIIFFLLLRARRHRRFDGATALLYVLLYGVLRSVVELFRGDPGRGMLGPVSIAQVVSVALAAAAALVLARGGAGPPGPGPGT
jgi:phosphatidylglycerol:prolipoprotein diacylglycerol transferase